MARRLFVAWIIALVFGVAAPAAAFAGGCGCGTTTVTTPPCCKPPTPPPATSPPCCGSGANQIVVPGVNVYVSPSVIVDTNVNAQVTASAAASGSGNGSATTTVLNNGGGGGGSSWFEGQGSTGLIQALNVDTGGSALQRKAYQSTRTKIRIVVVQAVCLDDKDVPHPASQVTPDREIAEGYEGEVYRCIAGARMQVTMADYNGRINFDHGQTFTCAKGEALYYGPGPGAGLAGGPGPGAPGKLECRVQKPARDCNERSLLRRFGAGVKIIKIITTETYTAYREEQVQSAATQTFSMSIDGGVGGIAH